MVTIMGQERYLSNITFPYFKQMIARVEVYSQKVRCNLKLIEKIINIQRRVLILDDKFVQLMVIHHTLREPSFFLTNNPGVPHGETLGLIKPLSRRSFYYFLCSFNFVCVI